MLVSLYVKSMVFYHYVCLLKSERTRQYIKMSIQWTIVATFLYTEISIVLLLVLPVASPQRWQKFFRSRFLHALSSQASMYFYILLFVLVLFLLDAIREMRKYSSSESGSKVHGQAHQLDLEMQVNMRLFRAQRNFYISGFALFLSFVIRRLVILISSLAELEAKKTAALRQATNATIMAKDLMSHTGVTQPEAPTEEHDKQITELKSKLSEITKELEAERLDKATLKKQSESLHVEYDRLVEEYNKLEKKLAIHASGDKKDD